MAMVGRECVFGAVRGAFNRNTNCIRCIEQRAATLHGGRHTMGIMLNYDDEVRVPGFHLSGSGGQRKEKKNVLKKRVNHDGGWQLANCVVCTIAAYNETDPVRLTRNEKNVRMKN